MDSPIFWVENKDRYLRQLLIRDIEEVTKRPLGVYFANPSFSSSIQTSDVGRLHEVIAHLDVAPFDLIVETTGGETDAAEAMISLLQHAKHPFRAIVPSRAKSNGTLICLAAETIVMGPTSELGPIEPSIEGVPASALKDIHVASNAVAATDGEFALDLWHAEHALKQTRLVATAALKMRMLKTSSDQQIANVIEALCGRAVYPSHGSVIDASQAAALGLAVDQHGSHDDLWKQIWLLYSMYRHDAYRAQIAKIFETNVVSLRVANGEL